MPDTNPANPEPVRRMPATQDELNNSLGAMLSTPRGYRMLLLAAAVLKRKPAEWTAEQMERLTNAIDGIADAMDADPLDIITALAELPKGKS